MIEVVYPNSGHTTAEASTFIMGHTQPASALVVQVGAHRQTIPVTTEGFFSHSVPLQPGANALTLTSTTGAKQTTHLTITRQGFSATPTAGLYRSTFTLGGSLPTQPLEAIADGPSFPVQVVSQATVTRLEVRWMDPDRPGHTVAQVPLAKRPNSSATPGFHDTRTAIFGKRHWSAPPIPNTLPLWEGLLTLPSCTGDSPGRDQRLVLEVLTFGTSGEPTVWQPGVKALRWSAPRQAVIRQDQAICRTAPVDGARLTPLAKGTPVTVLGHWNGWAAIALDDHLTGYVALSNVQLTGAKGALAPVTVTTVLAQPPTDQGVSLSVPLSRPVPYHVEAHAHRLDVTLYGASSSVDFIRQAEVGKASDQPQYEPPVSVEQATTHCVRLTLDSNRALCGWSAHWNGNDGTWQLVGQTVPSDPAAWVIALDPGHGGAERGGVALDGSPEKALNLHLAQLVARALKVQGFKHVHLLRPTDGELTLPARAKAVAALKPHVCLSLHHNALPDGRDPMAHQGAGVYYYHPMAWGLATALQQGLVQQAGCPDDGVWFNNLAMTRLSQCLAVLIEVGYMTHPDDCTRILNPDHQERMATALAASVWQFARRGG
jgi:N-acetylmuramoyl-L-alanine amidase